ncbi:MAG: MFS transporter [Acidimicrobiia bacterium]
MNPDPSAARWRYLVLLGLRWFPVGFLIPITVLLPLARGLPLSQVGVVFAAQGILVLALELPTGGLSDAWGRRPVLLLSSVVGIAALGMLVVADSFGEFLVVYALQGVYRALDSGPLEAWYIDATLTADPSAHLERRLSTGSAVLSAAIALGALASGGLVALDPFPSIDALTLPVLVAAGLSVLGALAIAVLMTEHRAGHERLGFRASARRVPQTVKDGVGLVRSNRVLLAIIAVELFWGFGMVSFEGLMPVRLAEVVDSSDRAAALMGPAASTAWLAFSAGAAVITTVSRRVGVAPTAALTRVLQGLAVVFMGLSAGPIGLVTAYLACYAIHGASNPLHMALLHHEVTTDNRSTIISLNSMVGQPSGAIGTVVLTALADATSVTTALFVGGVVLAVAAPLYLPAWRRERVRRLGLIPPRPLP